MARLARLAIAGQAHHVIQRGLNGHAPFVDAADRTFFLECLVQARRQHQVALHAYVLMEDHYQLLATIPDAISLSKMMQAVGRSYVRYFNDRHARRGTLWEGRYRSTVVQASRFMLPCMAVMDLCPVHAGLVDRAVDYPWSSHGHYAGVRGDAAVVPSAEYWALGNTPFAREAAYTEFVSEGVSPSERALIEESALHGWALGDLQFVAQMQNATARRVTVARPGRPKKDIISPS